MVENAEGSLCRGNTEKKQPSGSATYQSCSTLGTSAEHVFPKRLCKAKKVSFTSNSKYVFFSLDPWPI